MSNDGEFDAGFSEEIVQPDTEGRGVTIDDFVAYMPTHTYIFTPCREFWVGTSVNSRLPRVPALDHQGRPKRDAGNKPVTMLPTRWLDQNRAVEQMTWCPGLPMLIQNRLVVAGGWIERPDVTCFNLYRPPRLELGDPDAAGPWLEHVHAIFPEDAAHIMSWLAQRVQLPVGGDNNLIACSIESSGKSDLQVGFAATRQARRMYLSACRAPTPQRSRNLLHWPRGISFDFLAMINVSPASIARSIALTNAVATPVCASRIRLARSSRQGDSRWIFAP
jgi:hypothetical protein